MEEQALNVHAMRLNADLAFNLAGPFLAIQEVCYMMFALVQGELQILQLELGPRDDWRRCVGSIGVDCILPVDILLFIVV